MFSLLLLLAVLGGSIMLELAVPILAQLVAVPGVIDQQAAMAFFLVGAVHIALMFMALRVASTMVAGWQVFGFARQDAVSAGGNAMRAPTPAASNAMTLGAAMAAARSPAAMPGGQRRIDVAPAATTLAANDGSGAGGTIRETRVYATSSGGGQASPLAPGASRTRGIGNRFRSASKAPTAPVAAPMAANAKPSETYQ